VCESKYQKPQTNNRNSYTAAPTSVAAGETPAPSADSGVPAPIYTAGPTGTGTGTGALPAPTNGTALQPAHPTGSEVFEGSANRATIAGGALAGLLGAVAYLL
jgi:biotin carboxyl carrier protein